MSEKYAVIGWILLKRVREPDIQRDPQCRQVRACGLVGLMERLPGCPRLIVPLSRTLEILYKLPRLRSLGGG